MTPRITRVVAATVELPCRYPIESAVRSAQRVINVLVVVHTDEGVHGSAYIAAFTRGQARAIRALIDELAPMLTGLSVTETARAWERMRKACRLLGSSGPGTFALSAIDIAVWDAKAKTFGAPLHALLGTAQTQVAAYASDGCWLSPDVERTASEAATFAAEGFGAIKVRVGRRDRDLDLAVIDAVHASVGPEVDILVDANQGWSLQEARVMGRELEARGVRWFEEPIDAADLRGLWALQRELRLSVVAGESVSLPSGVRELVHSEGVSIVMPDLQRVGGITGWLRASGLTEASGLQLTSHLFPEISIHLLATSPGAGPLEYVSWMTPFLVDPLTIRDGTAQVPDRPGIGIEFDWTELEGCILD